MYIKLDKKLIVEIENITLNTKSKVKTTKQDIKSIIKKVPTVLKYFEKIDIEFLTIKDNKFKILFDNDFIYLDNKYINIASEYKVAGSTIELDLYSIYIKEQEAMFRGKLKLDYYKDILNFFGTYHYKEAQGELNLQATKDFIDFHVSSEKLKNLKFLKSLFRLPEVGEQWMYDNVVGEMKLNYLFGKLKTDTLEPILDEIKGDAIITNAEITFNKKVAPVKTKKLHIVFEKGILNFHMLKPKYKNIDIDGSFVKIPNLVNRKGRVQIDIKAKHILDEDVLEILRAYKINLPIKQLDGQTDAVLFLDVPYNGDLKVKGTFNIKDANLLLNKFSLYTKEAKVLLNNYDVLITSPSVKHKDMIDTKLKLDINIKTSSAKGEALLKSFLLKSSKSEIINIKDFKSFISVDFKKNTIIDLKELNTKISLEKEFTKVEVLNFDSIYKYSNLLQSIKIKDGNVTLKIKDANEIYIETNVKNLNIPITKDNNAISELSLSGLLKDEKITLSSEDKNFIINSEHNKTKLMLKNLDIFYKKEEKENSALFSNLSIELQNSNITIDDNIFYTKNSNILLDKDVIEIEGIFKKEDLPFYKDKKRVQEFDIKAVYKDKIFKLESKDKRINLILDDKSIDLNIKDIDLAYDTNMKEDNSLLTKIKAKDSSIIINDKYEVLATSYTLYSNKERTSFDLAYNNSKVEFLKDKNNKITVKASEINDKMVNTFFDKDVVSGGTIALNASSLDNILKGKITFSKNRINNLAVLNNIITLVNTTPALINPLLAIPAVFGMVKNGGFNLSGYAINEGYVNFIYNIEKKFLNMNEIKTIGNSVDFNGNSTIDFNKKIIDANVQLIFMKDYSAIVGYIPLINYVFLGDDKVVSTNIRVTGDLSDPIITSNIIEDSVTAPVNVIKRIFTTPFNILISDENKVKDINVEENKSNKIEAEEIKDNEIKDEEIKKETKSNVIKPQNTIEEK